MPASPWYLGFLLLSVVSGLALAAFLWWNARSARRGELPQRDPQARASDATVVIPVRGQAPERFARALDGAVAQRLPIVVVGDGCGSPYRELTLARGGVFLQLAEARGKKEALAAGVAMVRTPLVLLMDSDTVMLPGAVAGMLAHFTPEVGGVAPNLRVPLGGGLVPYLAEFVERSREVVHRAMSARGSVMLLEGACAMYRTELIRPFLTSSEFQDLRVFGRRVPLGDDWQLTGFLLERGQRAVKAYEVQVETPAPASLAGFLRQNVRWARSGWVRLGKEIRSGALGRRSRLYRYELLGAFLLPLLTTAAFLARVPFLLQRGLRALLPPLVNALVDHGLSALGSSHALLLVSNLPLLADIVATAAFLLVVARATTRQRWRTLLVAPLATLLLLLATLYGLATVWKADQWDRSSRDPLATGRRDASHVPELRGRTTSRP